MTPAVRDKAAKIERKVKKWRFNRIMDIFEYYFVYITHISIQNIPFMSLTLQKK